MKIDRYKKKIILPFLIIIMVLYFNSIVFADETGESQLRFSDDIKEHFFLGGEFYQNKKYDAALIEYSNIRQIDPSYIEGYIFPAKCYYNMKKYIEAAYYAAYTLYIEPENSEAKTLFSELKDKITALEFNDDKLSYVLTAEDKFEELVFRIYGSSIYLTPIIKQNGNKKDFKTGDKIYLPLDFGLIEGITKFKKFDGTTIQSDLESLKESIIEQKASRLIESDAEGYFTISEEYFKINRVQKALVAFEIACYIDSSYMNKKNSELVKKSLAEKGEQVKKDGKNAENYYYLAFLQYITNEYKESLANFSYASSLGLKSDLLGKTFKYIDLCKKNIKAIEAKEIEKEAILKASADASISNKMADVIKQVNEDEDVQTATTAKEPSDPAAAGEQADISAMTKEQKLYYCYQQRKKIEDGILKYNENNIVEMNSDSFSIDKLAERSYISAKPKCPDEGVYSMNHNGFVQCSVHGL